MASVYRKESGVYYISVMFRNKRITRSLGTHSYNTARKLIPKAEQDIFTELFGLGERQSKQISFSMLVKEYLNCPNQPWVDNTRIRYRHLLYSYIDKGLPDKPTTRAMTIRTVNACNNWGFKNGFIDKPVRLKGGSKWEARNKVFKQNELNQLIESIECPAFNRFVRFAYYTGARSGEIRSLRRENIKNDHIVVNGKTGPRMVGALASILCLQFKMLPQQLGQTTNQDKTLVVLGKTFIGLIVSNDTEHVITARSIHQHYFRPRLTDFPLFGRRLNCGRDLRKGLVVPVNAGQVPVYVGAG